ncbi:OB-fold domain-containing protein [Sphingobium sp. Sx8-8]|uniref:Zn-ribbon domain-containing OB-fold protein n=1 Tax=Sphingobium sp. Sx8-8 TaxID=2933617 RepID=UPI001F57453D|nr:OB-fold domain-containing protein [Sphingobium sp. Sx8-8]
MRLLPELTPETTAFWTGGERGELLITHCDACDHAIHPPELICPKCLSRSVTPKPASGKGTILTVTVNHQPWMPGLEVPYALAIVALDDQPHVRITSRIVGIAPDEVAIGMPVEVTFEQVEDVWMPQFRPAGA